ncbi:MAG: hypothetical protein ACFFCP_11340 [Promethearchaeota archaeon]
MTTDDSAARMTLKIAGVFQEIRDIWARRLDAYFTQIESLIDGQLLDTDDILGIIRESRLASREALDGLGSDLSSELVHTSNGVVARYEAMRSSLIEEIADLRNEISKLTSGDENTFRRENKALKNAIMSVPEFMLLQVVEKHRRITYDQLCDEMDQKKASVRKLVKTLMKRGYVHIDKKTRPHVVVYLTAPWTPRSTEDQQILNSPTILQQPQAQVEHQ